MRSRLCVHQFKAEGSDDLFAGTPDTLFIKCLLSEAVSCKDFGVLVVDISVSFMHARTDEEIYVKVPSRIKSSRFWRLKVAVNGTRKALARVPMRQARDKYAFPTKRHQSGTWNSTATIFWCVD